MLDPDHYGLVWIGFYKETNSFQLIDSALFYTLAQLVLHSSIVFELL